MRDLQPALDNWLDEIPLRREVIARILSHRVEAYLVGGTVRDALLGRPGYDLDVAVVGKAMSLARQVADEIHGAYVPLDHEHDVARVVVWIGGRQHSFDFAGLRAPDIMADLRARDFTVDAMAVRLEESLGGLLDPTQGQQDLEAKLLRAAYDGAFVDDPLRILRAVRLSGSLGFALTPDTEHLAKASLPALASVSQERIRDELIQILLQHDSARSLVYAASLGVTAVVLPEAGTDRQTWDRAARVVDALESCFGRWSPRKEGVGDTPAHPLATLLSPYGQALAQHWGEELSSGRTRWVIVKLAALLSVVPDDARASNAVRRLRFGRREVRHVTGTLVGSRWADVWAGERADDALSFYRYFRAVGSAGVDGAILRTVSDLSAGEGTGTPKCGLRSLPLSGGSCVAGSINAIQSWTRRYC